MRRNYGVALSGFAVEFGWAVGESVMIPRLLGLGLSPAIAGLIFLVNPVFSVFLGPYLGAAFLCSSRRASAIAPSSAM